MPRPKEYIQKKLSFAKGNPEEMKLYKWLQRLPHGQFSEETKAYWLNKMKEEKK